MYRCIDCSLYRPPDTDTFCQCLVGHISFACPLCESQRFAVKCVALGICRRSWKSLIVILFGAGSPTTIFRRIWPIIVDTINAVFGARARAHIRIEILERVQPTFAHGNTARAPIWVVLAGRIAATISQSAPCAVLRGTRHSMLARPLSVSDGNFLSPTTTTFGISSAQAISIYNYNIAAIATATPIDFAWMTICRTFSFLNHSQTPKAFTCTILESLGVFRGIIEGHSDLHSRCVKPWGVSAPPGQFVGVPLL